MTATLRQREPRVEYPAYLAYVRTQPCTVSGRPPPSDAAHLRAAAPQYGKRHTGKGEKPHDWWTLPLNHDVHMDQHRHGDELAWWRLQGIPDPFALAKALYEGRPAMPPPPAPKPFHERATKPRKPREQRKAVPAGRPLQSGAKMQSRKMRG